MAFDVIEAASHISGARKSQRWYHLTVKFPTRIRFKDLYTHFGGFIVRLDGPGWMADVYSHHFAETAIIRQTRGNRDRMFEDLLATRLSM